jgi:hypothetical protein
MPIVVSVLLSLRSLVRSRAALHLEILALRHQLQVLERSRRPRLRLTVADRLLWVWFSRIWTEWRPALVLVQPDTVVAWHRRGFRLFWALEKPTPLDRNAFPRGVPARLRWRVRRIAGAIAAMQIQEVVTAPRSPWQNWTGWRRAAPGDAASDQR